MKYVVKDADDKKMLMEVITSIPQLPEGWVVLGKADDLPNDIAEIEAAAALEASSLALTKIVADAELFGRKLMQEFAVENIVLGITADGMTGTVRKNMVEVISALQTASLYDAIAEAKAIPAEKKDSKYITDVRLLAFINKIETYLNIPLSTEL